MRIDCTIFEAGDAAQQAALWERFVARSPQGIELVEDARVVAGTGTAPRSIST